MAEVLTRVEVDCGTGTTRIIPLTPAELRELATRQAEAEAERTAQEAEAAQKEADRQAGIATLKGLGLTDAQITALLG
jgi:hypothetical protein